MSELSNCFIYHLTNLDYSLRVPSQFMIPSSILITKRCEIVAHYADQSGYLAVFSANGDIMITQELQVRN